MADKEDQLLNEQALVDDCLSGHTASFEGLVEKYQGPLFNAALRMVHDYDEARDITQAAFVRAYERLATYDSQYKFFSWIYRIMVNESLNVLQRNRRTTSLETDIATNDSNPEVSYYQKELGEQIQTELMNLAVDSRVILVLRHFADLSLHEIGYVLEIPEKTVKSRLFTARERLRGRLVHRGIGRHS
ncbi:MAG: sigma-70 family RNA polymerase sigma factor [candidate division Zixibacteria bacterium]|nr:sigma-70 family RNA polymerase sigma factor [candidate division Zixibacteria bacterium]